MIERGPFPRTAIRFVGSCSVPEAPMTPGRTCSQDHRKADPCGGLSVRLSTRPLFPPSSALQEWRQDQRRAQFRRAGQERWTGRPDAWDSRARARMGVGRHGREGAGHTAGRATVPRLQRASSSGHRGQSISPPCMPRVRAGRARFKCSLRRAGPHPGLYPGPSSGHRGHRTSPPRRTRHGSAQAVASVLARPKLDPA